MQNALWFGIKCLVYPNDFFWYKKIDLGGKHFLVCFCFCFYADLEQIHFEMSKVPMKSKFKSRTALFLRLQEWLPHCLPP